MYSHCGFLSPKKTHTLRSRLDSSQDNQFLNRHKREKAFSPIQLCSLSNARTVSGQIFPRKRLFVVNNKDNQGQSDTTRNRLVQKNGVLCVNKENIFVFLLSYLHYPWLGTQTALFALTSINILVLTSLHSSPAPSNTHSDTPSDTHTHTRTQIQTQNHTDQFTNNLTNKNNDAFLQHERRSSEPPINVHRCLLPQFTRSQLGRKPH